MKRTMNEIELALFEFAIEHGFRETLNEKELPSFEYLYEQCQKNRQLELNSRIGKPRS